MEDTLSTGEFPIETPIPGGFSIATFDFRMVNDNRVKLLRIKSVGICGYKAPGYSSREEIGDLDAGWWFQHL